MWEANLSRRVLIIQPSSSAPRRGRGERRSWKVENEEVVREEEDGGRAERGGWGR